MSDFSELESVLVTEDQIKTRIKMLGRELESCYGSGAPLTIITILNGAMIFTSDLLRQLRGAIRVDSLRVSSYGKYSTESSGTVKFDSRLSLDLFGHHVLIVDDILDTGRTLSAVSSMIKSQGPKSLKVCVLLDKKARRQIPFEADFVGFEIPDKFVVGYGLDFAEKYRNLPVIGVLKPELQREETPSAASQS